MGYDPVPITLITPTVKTTRGVMRVIGTKRGRFTMTSQRPTRPPLLCWLLQAPLVMIFCTPARNADLKSDMAFAASQHEIIITLINEEKFNQIMPEVRKLCSIKFPEQYEERLAK